MQKDRFLTYRYLSYVAAITSVFGAALMFLVGVTKTVEAYANFLRQLATPLVNEPVATNKSIALLIQSIDSFLIGMVFLVFAYGVTTLFIRSIDLPEANVLRWVRIDNINHLKIVLGEMIIIVLFVNFLEIILLSGANLEFEMLVLPVGIVLMALALKFLDWGGKPAPAEASGAEPPQDTPHSA